MNKFGLLGESLTHSYSKIIHSKLYKYYNLDYSYELINVKIEELSSYVDKIRSKEYTGFNITIPYKKEILKYVDVIHNNITSCNTIMLIDNKVHAFNTDIDGFKYMLNYYNLKLSNCVILGSGGASLSVQKVLNEYNINYNVISRSNDGYRNLDCLNKVVINTTPIGMYPNIDFSVLSKENASSACMIIDLIYNPKITKIMSYNKESYNGLVMLVYQAIKSFELWTNIVVDNKVIEKIINEVGE